MGSRSPVAAADRHSALLRVALVLAVCLQDVLIGVDGCCLVYTRETGAKVGSCAGCGLSCERVGSWQRFQNTQPTAHTLQ